MSPVKQEMIKAIITNNSLSEEEKSKIIAEIIEEFEKTYPELKYHATKSDVKEVELKLTKEIEKVRKEIKEVEANLKKEIKEVEANLKKEMKEMELNFQKEIKNLDVKIENVKSTLLKWTFAFWVSQMGAILGIGFFVLKMLKL